MDEAEDPVVSAEADSAGPAVVLDRVRAGGRFLQRQSCGGDTRLPDAAGAGVELPVPPGGRPPRAGRGCARGADGSGAGGATVGLAGPGLLGGALRGVRRVDEA
jgi:hypothetical protein